MPNMIGNNKGSGGKSGGSQKKNTISVYSVGPIAQVQIQRAGDPSKPVPLPRAVAIYGAASAVFAVLTVFYLVRGPWWTGLIMIMPTLCLAGYAWYYLKVSDQKPWK